IASAVWDAYLKHADLGLDLHGWTGCSLSLVWGLKKELSLLRAFGLPWYMVVDKPGKPSSGMIETLAWARGISMLTCELVPQNTINPESVRLGARGILNSLKFIGMLEGRLELPEAQYEFPQRHEEMVLRTPAEGLLVSDCVKGQWVRKGQRVLRILSLETLATAWEFRAPHDALVFNIGGVMWGEDMPDNSVVFPGQVVALLKKPSRIIRNHKENTL
ncbi:MAG: succinylglutamate desuccinylase/aspartoacylase family protein, partial [Verrucomicrobia bacterium]|nr:succinylglutamate desuccinylase/aspartoacylase family protein [Verrucomicrobiota bacterium]